MDKTSSSLAAPVADSRSESEPRFAFGENWRRFLALLNDERIAHAETSLREMLGVDSLHGKTFLDIGSGSGLFSLAARRLGARVHSLDLDPQAVACAETLRARFFPGDPSWTFERASALDTQHLRDLGGFDIVYSWGVLHHTGAMWQALENAAIPVVPGGQLFVALYNDQGLRSKLWWWVKRAYVSGPLGKGVVLSIFVPHFALGGAAKDLLHGRKPWSRYRSESRNRGMSPWHDWVDWVGGFPFEVASPADTVEFFKQRGFELERELLTRSHGNNQFVFRRR